MKSSLPAPSSRVAARGPRVLVVDDDPSVVRALLRMLKNARPDFRIHTADNAAQAIEAIQVFHYDAVVTDLQMPNGTGVEVLQYLAVTHPETLRVLHTSQPEALEPSAYQLAHVVLKKPASEPDFIAALEESPFARLRFAAHPLLLG